jgi:hypothetical protein
MTAGGVTTGVATTCAATAGGPTAGGPTAGGVTAGGRCKCARHALFTASSASCARAVRHARAARRAHAVPFTLRAARDACEGATRARELASRSAVPAAITLRRLAGVRVRPPRGGGGPVLLLPLLRVLSWQLWPRLSPFRMWCVRCASQSGEAQRCRQQRALSARPPQFAFVHSMSTAGGVHSRGVVAGQPGQGRNVLI